MAEIAGAYEPDTITATFVLDRPYLKETYARFRSSRMLAKTRRLVVLVLALVLLGCAALLAFRSPGVAAFFFGCSMFMFFSNSLSNLISIRSVRKTNLFNLLNTVHFTEDGLVSESELGKSELKWPVFLKATFFKDGVLLFQTNRMVRWIPDKSLETVQAAASLRKLIAARMPIQNR